MANTFRTTTATTSSTFCIATDDNIGLVDNRRLVRMEQDIADLRQQNLVLLDKVQKLTTELERLKEDSLELLRSRVLSFQLA